MKKAGRHINKNMEQFLLYLLVGGAATMVEWASFYLCNRRTHYFTATGMAFCISTFVNWILGRMLIFKGRARTSLKELCGIYITSVIGLAMNLWIMWIAVNTYMISPLISKVIATGIVFFWNFLVRKYVIYKV